VDGEAWRCRITRPRGSVARSLSLSRRPASSSARLLPEPNGKREPAAVFSGRSQQPRDKEVAGTAGVGKRVRNEAAS
jgi:hypothetical protein